MWCMAGHATFGLDGSVLPGKRAGFVGVAAEAYLVLRRSGAQLLRQEPAVLVVTVGAKDQPFVHAMVKRLGENRLHFQVAGVAKGRLPRLEQLPVDFGSVDGVAVHTSHVVQQVRRAQEVRVLLAEFVAAQAAPRRLLAGKAGETDDLVRIGGFRMGFSRAMTGFAT